MNPNQESGLIAFYYETGDLKYVGTLSPSLSLNGAVQSRFEISSFFRGNAPNQYQLSMSSLNSNILIVSDSAEDKYALMRVRLGGEVDSFIHYEDTPGSMEQTSSYRMTAVTHFTAGSLAGGHKNKPDDDYEHFCPFLMWLGLTTEWNVD